MDHLRCREKITMTISEERKKRIIDLYYNQGKTTREIAKIERVSIRDISPTLKEEESKRQRYKDQRQQEEVSSKAYKLFSKGKHPVDVAIALNLRQPEATKLYNEYWKLKQMHILDSIFKETNGKLGPFLKLFRLMKEKHMNTAQVIYAVDIAANRLPYMESLYNQLKDEVDKLQYTIQGLLKNRDDLKYKISILDKTAFSIEQDCKRKQQQLQALTAQKDRLEKWIRNISNNDELKQLVKENVKAALSENKQVISVALTALLQTLTSDPETINIIYKILTTNEDEQHKDDNNDNVTKYLESNKDKILNLVEKNYQNLVEALTNKFIGTTITASPSSSPTLSLPQSSSTFPNLSDQSNTYRIEEPEIYDDSKGDIAD
jgi:hypothetical protein